MKLEDFFTKTIAETSKKWYIPTIDGQITKEWLTLFGTECTAFQNAKTDYMRACMLGKGDSTFDKGKAYAEFTSSLVDGWSFKIPPTKENIVNLLYNAPYISVGIDNFSSILGNKVEQVKKTSSAMVEHPSN